MAENKPKKTRKSHPKTRTGCLTCKIRRKKCDEEKPACLRCTSTGRKCDGYPVLKTHHCLPKSATRLENAVDHWADLEQVYDASVSVEERTDFDTFDPETLVDGKNDFAAFDACQDGLDSDGALPQGLFDTSASSVLSIDRHHNHPLSTRCSLSVLEYHVPLTLQPTLSPFATEKDFFCFDFFCRQTNPLFTHYFETTLWAGPMMQACFQPAVQQAMIALGAVHRRYELGITPEAFEYCAFSMKAYSKAMSSSRELLEMGGSQRAELAVILSWLFGVFEVFQGNDDLACQHLKAGLRAFFLQKFKKQESRTVRRSVSLTEENARKLFRKLELKSNEIFGEPARLLSTPGDASDFPEVPVHFYSLDHARDVIFTQIHWNLWALSHDEQRDSSDRLASLSDRVARLLQWSVSYAKLCQGLTIQTSPCQGSRQVASCLLRLCRELSYIILLLRPAATREYETGGSSSTQVNLHEEAKGADTMNNHFARVLISSDRLLNSDIRVFEQSLKRPSFGVDSGIQPPLYLAATKCRTANVRMRSTKIRHQAQILMKDTPKGAKMRQALGAYNIAERASMLEEEAALSCGALPADIANKVRWVDLTCYLEERKLLRSYCVPEEGTGVDGLVWVQEWMTF